MFVKMLGTNSIFLCRLNAEYANDYDIVCVQPPKTWTPCVEDKPYKGQLFSSFEEAFGYYKDYARKSGFEIRKATTEISRNGSGYSRRYIVCNREGENKKKKRI